MSGRLHILIAVIGAAAGAASAAARAEDLYRHDNWAAFASDRNAAQVGDSLTILVFENSSASQTSENSSRKDNKIQGEISAGKSLSESAQLGFGGRFQGVGQTVRAGRMVAQIGAVVDRVLPNGDLLVFGQHHLNINRERTRIEVRGRVRRQDIQNNSVLSTRLADAVINYNGSGFVSRGSKPGIITRIFSFLGIM